VYNTDKTELTKVKYHHIHTNTCTPQAFITYKLCSARCMNMLAWK